MSTIGSNFKITLKACRINADLSQEELAKKLGVSKNTVVAWETGKSEISFTNLTKLSQLSGIPIDFIFCPQT